MLKWHFKVNYIINISFFAILFFIFSAFSSIYLKNIQDDLVAEATFIASTIKTPLASGKYQEVERLVQEFYYHSQRSFAVVDGQGKKIASVGELPTEGLPLGDILKGKKYVDKFRASVAVFLENGVVWAVVVGLPPEEVGKITQIQLLFLIFTFLGLIGSTFIWKKAYSSIVKQIKRMIEAARNIAEGHFNSTVHVDSSDGVGKLSRELNLLAKKMRITLDELEETKSLMNDLLLNMVDGVVVVDIERRIKLINPTASRLTGAHSKAAIGKKLISIIRHYELDEAVRNVIKNGSSYSEEIVLLPREQILEVHITPYRDNKGKISGSFIFMRDITELRRLERMRSEFVANVSHELRTPLTSIKGFIETLLDGAYKDPALTKRFLRIIDAETGRLCRLIDNMLDLSRIETNQLKLRIRDVSAGELIKEVMLFFENRFSEKDLTFSENIPDDLPKVKADPDWLRQVFINLLDNAIKYTPKGGKVWIEAEPKDDVVEFRVCDTGIGIPEEDLPRIFERFYKVDKARSPEKGGSGLGLAIVKHLVKSFGGDIRVESKLNQGSKFIFTLKRSK
ncbi:MAG: cell wall metabolism sensor histidine kinase WalK [Thermosediminibacteraceae bacterium]|nr:cell wall metabolism sensor histidine kinase WalK [Thermosediminibacteraceae bacterium]